MRLLQGKAILHIPALMIFLFISSFLHAEEALAHDYGNLLSFSAGYTARLFLNGNGIEPQPAVDDGRRRLNRMGLSLLKEGRFEPDFLLLAQIPARFMLFDASEEAGREGFRFDALKCYRSRPSLLNGIMVFLDNFDSLSYTDLAKRQYSEPLYPEIEPASDRGRASIFAVLTVVVGKALLDAYRLHNEKVRFVPTVLLDKNTAILAIRFNF